MFGLITSLSSALAKNAAFDLILPGGPFIFFFDRIVPIKEAALDFATSPIAGSTSASGG
jgi:hypothetical protein